MSLFREARPEGLRSSLWDQRARFPVAQMLEYGAHIPALFPAKPGTPLPCTGRSLGDGAGPYKELRPKALAPCRSVDSGEAGCPIVDCTAATSPPFFRRSRAPVFRVRGVALGDGGSVLHNGSRNESPRPPCRSVDSGEAGCPIVDCTAATSPPFFRRSRAPVFPCTGRSPW
jgi:hypothetical protein